MDFDSYVNSELKETHMREAIQLAHDARTAGNHPFGALIYNLKTGEIIVRAENGVHTNTDVTSHAELEAIRRLCKVTDISAGDCVLVTSTEPCAMCCGAIYWSGIRAVCYGLSEEGLYEIAGDDIALRTPSRQIFSNCAPGTEVAVDGPNLVDEARKVHHGFWV